MTQKTPTIYDMTTLLREDDLEPLNKVLNKYDIDDVKDKEVTKVNLAYEIDDTKTAFMCVVKFKANSGVIEKLNKDLRLSSKILRHLIIKEEEVLPEDGKRRADKRSSKPKPEKAEVKTDSEEPLTNKALEKKIEEISD